MIVLGVVLLLLGWAFGIGILETLGVILIVIGAVVWLLGVERTGGRRWY